MNPIEEALCSNLKLGGGGFLLHLFGSRRAGAIPNMMPPPSLRTVRDQPAQADAQQPINGIGQGRTSISIVATCDIR